MPLSPYFRTPLTDLLGVTMNQQMMSPCADFEMRMVNCMEAYGELLALKKCKDVFEDLMECTTKDKQMARVIEMKKERERQIKAGERAVPYAEGPAHDSFEPQL